MIQGFQTGCGNTPGFFCLYNTVNINLMNAYILKELNQPPTLAIVPEPIPADDQVTVRVLASALNHRDVWITRGLYPGIRPGAVMGSDAVVTFEGNEYIINPGLDWGSRQVYQGPSFRVLGVPDDGVFSDYMAIGKQYLYPKPTHLNTIQAAALPLAGVTAYRALFRRAQLQQGETVLISGVGGGVAMMAMQLALAAGCKVLVTSGSEWKITRAMELGAHAGFLYTEEGWEDKVVKIYGGVDVVIDGACGPGFSGLLKVCRPGGRIVFYGATSGKITELNPQPVFWKQISILGSTMGSDQDFADMVDFVTAIKMVPVVDHIFPFTKLPEAFALMQEGRQFGKIVVEH